MFDADDPLLERLRGICQALPGVEERVSHGRPTFRAGKIFAAYGGSEKLRPGDHRQVPSALIFTPDPVDLPALDDDDRRPCFARACRRRRSPPGPRKLGPGASRRAASPPCDTLPGRS